jgi:hypothetical protein
LIRWSRFVTNEPIAECGFQNADLEKQVLLFQSAFRNPESAIETIRN